MRSLAFLFVLIFTLVSCGKYGSPLPPEDFSPRAVRDLEIFATTDGVRFQWKSPETDFRGKELKSMDGYNVYKRQVIEAADAVNDDVEFELIETIKDLHIEERDRLRKEAEKEGKIARKVKVDESLMQFWFSDTELIPGETYLYQIVPYNQGDVEGEAQQMVRVVFRGESSIMTLVSGKESSIGSF